MNIFQHYIINQQRIMGPPAAAAQQRVAVTTRVPPSGRF